jgi:hypothetical protein
MEQTLNCCRDVAMVITLSVRRQVVRRAPRRSGRENVEACTPDARVADRYPHCSRID